METRNNPQTMAAKIGEVTGDRKLIAVGKWGCCAFTALWIVGLEDATDNICTVIREMGKGLDSECTVFWSIFYKNITGKVPTVERREIKSLDDVKDIYRCAVRFDYNGNGHWVGVEYGNVAFNSLEFSKCVTYGKPVTARIIRW